MAASPSGFALRLNGSSCLRQEVDCGTTLPPYRVCCPEGSFCPAQYNVNVSFCVATPFSRIANLAPVLSVSRQLHRGAGAAAALRQRDMGLV